MEPAVAAFSAAITSRNQALALAMHAAVFGNRPGGRTVQRIGAMAGGDDDAVALGGFILSASPDVRRGNPERIEGGAAIFRKQAEGMENGHLRGLGRRGNYSRQTFLPPYIRYRRRRMVPSSVNKTYCASEGGSHSSGLAGRLAFALGVFERYPDGTAHLDPVGHR